jgi:exodeoxyribonuclease V gamma subunit
MVRLVYSNRTEELLIELATSIRAQQLRDGPLVPVSIVVPSASVDAYVRTGIATTCGVAANLDVARLTRFASDLAMTATGFAIADAASIEAMALALLFDDDALAADDLTPVRTYLLAGGTAGDSVDTRRVQLSARIGRLFEEYTYSRAEMLTAWRDGLTLGARDAETERWQRRMWLAMFGAGGVADRLGASGSIRRATPLHEAVAALGQQTGPLPAAVHVFAFSHVARTFHGLLDQLARRTEVVIYALAPCEGFWEDIDARDPEPVQLWAKPGREQVRALNAMAAFDHEDRFVDPLDTVAAPTLLRRIQSDIMRRERRSFGSPGVADLPPDESLAVLEHASIRRELEAVASDIWRLCGVSEHLKFDEIAVLVPEGDGAEYAAQLSTVFREAHGIPHQTVGLASGVPTGVIDAVTRMLALPLSRFTRQDLLGVLVHPLISGSMGEVDPQRWVAWSDDLGIVHGADRRDHEGTYIERDILSWDQGLRRLALGSFMAGDATGDRRPVEMDGQSYVPLEVSPSDAFDATAFGVLARSLMADARFASESTLTLAQWGSFLRAFVDTYVVPEDSADEEELADCLRRLHGMAQMDLGERRIGYRAARELALARLETTPRGRGGEGVVISTIAAVRPLPFRVVYACGLGEGHFPSPEADDPLDLRWALRREGDVTARERDRYAFLETLIGTRDRFVMSYVSRDAVTGDGLAPSSVVHELLQTLSEGYVLAPSALRVRHPLRRWDPCYFPELFGSATDEGGSTMSLPEAHAEARTLALRQSLEASGGRASLEETLRRASSDPAWAALAAHLMIPTLPSAIASHEARTTVSLYAILKFLEFPLQGWARFRLGLEERDDSDIMAVKDEPFETAARETTTFLRTVLLDAVATGRSLVEAYDAEVGHRELRGLGPSGLFARGERANHLTTLETWRKELASNGVALASIEVHRLGPAGEHARADAVHDPLRVDVDVVDRAGVARLLRVEVAGRTQPMGAGGSPSLALFVRGRESIQSEAAQADRERIALRALVEHVVLSASGIAPGRPRYGLTVIDTPDGPVTDKFDIQPVSQDQAIGWVRDVLRDMLGGPHDYFLPCEVVLSRARRDPDGPVLPAIVLARDKLASSDGPPALRSTYGPVPRAAEYPVPDESTACQMIARRFGMLLSLRGERP